MTPTIQEKLNKKHTWKIGSNNKYLKFKKLLEEAKELERKYWDRKWKQIDEDLLELLTPLKKN